MFKTCAGFSDLGKIKGKAFVGALHKVVNKILGGFTHFAALALGGGNYLARFFFGKTGDFLGGYHLICLFVGAFNNFVGFGLGRGDYFGAVVYDILRLFEFGRQVKTNIVYKLSDALGVNKGAFAGQFHTAV